MGRALRRPEGRQSRWPFAHEEKRLGLLEVAGERASDALGQAASPWELEELPRLLRFVFPASKSRL
jgi:hypothetical protein